MKENTISFKFSTLDIPPPFAHQYTLTVKIKGDQLDVSYDLNYLDRDQISDEEIATEGFTDNDDFSWSGSLNPVWIEVIQTQLASIHWDKENLPDEFSQTALTVLNKTGGNHFETVLYDNESMEYFIQELIQAIYETAKRESPLLLKFMKMNNKKSKKLEIAVHFSSREMLLRKGKEKEESYPWVKGKSLLSLVYLADYASKPHKTSKDGHYVSFDDANWFNLEQTEKEEEIPEFTHKIKSQLPDF